MSHQKIRDSMDKFTDKYRRISLNSTGSIEDRRQALGLYAEAMQIERSFSQLSQQERASLRDVRKNQVQCFKLSSAELILKSETDLEESCDDIIGELEQVGLNLKSIDEALIKLDKVTKRVTAHQRIFKATFSEAIRDCLENREISDDSRVKLKLAISGTSLWHGENLLTALHITLFHASIIEAARPELDIQRPSLYALDEADLPKHLTMHADQRSPVSDDERHFLRACAIALQALGDTFSLRVFESIDQQCAAELDAIYLRFLESLRHVEAAITDAMNLPRLAAKLAIQFVKSDETKLHARLEKVLAKTEAEGAPKHATMKGAKVAPSSSRNKLKGSKGRAVRQVIATPEPGNLTTEIVRERVRAYPEPPDIKSVETLDFAHLSEKLGLKVSPLIAQQASEADPLNIGVMIRECIDSRFGNKARWRALSSKLSSEPDAIALRSVADTRVQKLQALEDRLDVLVLDLVKTSCLPKARHVAHLLDRDRIASVTGFQLLPSESDPEIAKGTLFEACIRATPLLKERIPRRFIFTCTRKTPSDLRTAAPCLRTALPLSI